MTKYRFVINFMLVILLSSACKNEQSDLLLNDELLWDEFNHFVKSDIAAQLKCGCVNIVYDESLHDEQTMLLQIGYYYCDMIEHFKEINLGDVKFLFVRPPDFVFEEQTNSNCETVSMANVLVSNDQRIFYATIRGPNAKGIYYLLQVRNKDGKWVHLITGAL